MRSTERKKTALLILALSLIGFSVILLAIGCEPHDALGEAHFRLCRDEQTESCEDQSKSMRSALAVFSSSWSRFERGGVVAVVAYPVDPEVKDDKGATGLLWIDLDLRSVPTTDKPLASDRWIAEYMEQTSEKIIFKESIQTGSIEVTDYSLSDSGPLSVAFLFDLDISKSDERLRVFGELFTHGYVGERQNNWYDTGSAGGSSVVLDTYEPVCYDCNDCENCYPYFSYVFDQHESSGCGAGDEYDDDESGCSSSDPNQGSSCEGDTYEDSDSSCKGDDSDYESSDSSCEGDDGDYESSDSSCEGDEYTKTSGRYSDYRVASVCPTLRSKRSRSVLSRQLNLLLPAFSVWILCYFRRRSLRRTSGSITCRTRRWPRSGPAS